MTAATAQLCGHGWAGHGVLQAIETGIRRHVCGLPPDHPPPCRCRCGATTERSTTRCTTR